MTIKNTILISAATYLVLNFAIWALGWMIWPIAWLAMGYGSAKVWDWMCRKSGFKGIESGEKAVAIFFGPIIGILAFILEGYKFVSWPNWLPTIRNPFVWPQKEVDKSSDQ